MKKPSDHFTITYPFNYWLKNLKSYAWGSAAPSRPLAYATLLLLSAKKDWPITQRSVHDWAFDFKVQHPHSWMATVVKMFGRAWKQDPKTEILCAQPRPKDGNDLAGQLALSYFLLAAGLETWSQFNGVLENTPAHLQDLVFREVKSWPGLEQFYKEVELAIRGEIKAVPWLNVKTGTIRGFYLRQVQAMSLGDSVGLAAKPRGYSASQLQAKIQSLLSNWAFDLAKKRFSMELEPGIVRVTRVL